MGKKFLRKAKFFEALKRTTEGRDLTVVVETAPTMRKTNNPFAGKVMKHTIMEVRLNHDYQGEVNERRLLEGKEANFEAKPLAWGQRVMFEGDDGKQLKTPLVEHKSQLYLHCQVLKSGKPTYMVEGRPASEDELVQIAAFLPEKEEGKGQGVEDPVVARTFKLESVIALVVDGRTIPLI